MSQDCFTKELSTRFEDVKQNDILGAETELVHAINEAEVTGDYKPAIDALRSLTEQSSKHVSRLSQPYRGAVEIEACKALREMNPAIIGCVLGQVT